MTENYETDTCADCLVEIGGEHDCATASPYAAARTAQVQRLTEQSDSLAITRDGWRKQAEENAAVVQRLTEEREPCARVHVDPDSQHLLDIIERQEAQVQRLTEERNGLGLEVVEWFSAYTDLKDCSAQLEAALRGIQTKLTSGEFGFNERTVELVDIARAALPQERPPQEPMRCPTCTSPRKNGTVYRAPCSDSWHLTPARPPLYPAWQMPTQEGTE